MADVSVVILRKAITAILDHIESDLRIDKVKLEEDFYWNVDSDELYRSKHPPAQLNLGSLHDDWEFLREAATDNDQAVALLLVHAAPLLRYIGEKIGQ